MLYLPATYLAHLPSRLGVGSSWQEAGGVCWWFVGKKCCCLVLSTCVHAAVNQR